MTSIVLAGFALGLAAQTDAEGKKFAVAFELRGDVDANACTWKAKPAEFLVVRVPCTPYVLAVAHTQGSGIAIVSLVCLWQ